MSFMITTPEFMAETASDLAAQGSAVQSDWTAIAPATTTVLASGLDDVSNEIASYFKGAGEAVKSVGVQIDASHQVFVKKILAAAESYAIAEAENSSPLKSLTDLAANINTSAHALFEHSPIRGAASKAFQGFGGLVNGLHEPASAAAEYIYRTIKYPFLHQIIQNQRGYFDTLVTALKSGKPLNMLKAFNTVINQFEDNTYHVIKEFSNFGVDFNMLGLNLNIGAPLALFADGLGAPILGGESLLASYQAFARAIHSGDPLGALHALTAAPGSAIHSFFHGQGAFEKPIDITLMGKTIHTKVQIPFGGLFAPLTTINIWDTSGEGGWAPLGGTPLGGFFTGLEREFEHLADIITPKSATF